MPRSQKEEQHGEVSLTPAPLSPSSSRIRVWGEILEFSSGLVKKMGLQETPQIFNWDIFGVLPRSKKEETRNRPALQGWKPGFESALPQMD